MSQGHRSGPVSSADLPIHAISQITEEPVRQVVRAVLATLDVE